MSGHFHNANNALRFLDGKGIDTSVGRVIPASDVDEAIKIAQGSQLLEATAPRPKTMVQAKRMVRQDEDLMASFDYNRQEDIGGSAVQAGPDPSSRT